MLRHRMLIICFPLFFGFMLFLNACNDEGIRFKEDAGEQVSEEQFADAVVSWWLGVDFSHNNPDGTTDSDGDGKVDTNDAVNFVETFSGLGDEVPPTSIQGLYENYYTTAGYGQTEFTPLADSEKISYTYTVDSPVAQADLEAYDWSGLTVGDLIFVDHDKDFVWDNAAVYLGAYNGIANAVILASDYYDRVIILDLDDEDEIIVLDIIYGYSDVKTPAYDQIAGN